ncbi:GNAT family N-acetyltransferase [Micromonospora sp. DT228]|uniref:GNAT family N-acetyltransferase n=1 Tax=Micromonospora sp. DT228 TaxID=3393443 RepID=UPI003CF071D3
MLTVQRLRADHADALLAFERENRAYFARSVPDRGDAYFSRFADRHRALLAEQEEGLCHFHVVLTEQGDLVGRVNLVDVAAGFAELGYRVGERAAGKGVATAAVEQVCHLAADDYRLAGLTALATLDNPASQAVLARTGFTVTGETSIGGRPALLYQRQLAGRPARSVVVPERVVAGRAQDRPADDVDHAEHDGEVAQQR